jgi:hypothetical protein
MQHIRRKSFMCSDKKGRQKTACLMKGAESNVRLRFTETGNAVAFLPDTTLFEQVDALETFQDVALDDNTTGTLETFVLRHD